MGLDMYLHDGGKNEIAYWRKANQIHKWFVDHVQDGKDDGQSYPVTLNQLGELQSLCREVLADHDSAEKLLPVQPGFFFGSYEYDDMYFDDLADTVKQIDNVLDLYKFDPKLSYCAWW